MLLRTTDATMSMKQQLLFTKQCKLKLSCLQSPAEFEREII